eukprot:CAMPEP_0174268906 /NCGR_PEP_ID=MMETSP0439-20130205/39150_1 /TAXON_ID=0 /ORGANISM="Stereomyxa ramosa, Strain Chinc5" /LENGTH=157 /DNA_ID=CAMNT_0015357383 /DNA_START=32 /DNA_END=505 /DNA_ORIENTATION=+
MVDAVLAEEEESDKSVVEIEVTPTLIEYVQQLAQHPQTFTNFPISSQAEFEMSAVEERHAKTMLTKVPELSRLRYILCPSKMREEVFWRIYFLLLENKLSRVVAQGSSKKEAPVEMEDIERYFEELFSSILQAHIGYDEGIPPQHDNYFDLQYLESV